jgi:hypothetical protein
MTQCSMSRDEVARLQEEFRARGGQPKRLPTHAPGTGSIRYNFRKRDFSQSHDYVVWAETCDTRQRFSMRVERVKDTDAAMDAFQAVYPDASIVSVHEVR